MTDTTKEHFITTGGFIKRYMANLKVSKTNEDAYNLTEEEFYKEFGINKYSSYDSFRVVKNRRFKKN